MSVATVDRVLALDVGAGTTDVLLWDRHVRGENQTHLVIPSATLVVAAEIREATQRGLPVVFRGPLMGGGACASATRRHVGLGLPFYAVESAAKTFADDLDEVAEMGVTVVGEEEVARLSGGPVEVRSGDVRLDDLLGALRLLGEARRPEGIAVAVQDHGEAPRGVSDRVFRFEKFAEALGRSRRLADLFYPPGAVPVHFTRLAAVSNALGNRLPVVVGDTGPSALWGAAVAVDGERCLAVNFGNGHTLMSLVEDAQVDGLFEHHTSQIDPARMQEYMRRFAAGDLSNDEIFAAGGHGVMPVSAAFHLDEVNVVVTGPSRRRFAEAGRGAVEAGVFGDMMLTGCWGLLQGFFGADDRREGTE